MAMGSSLDQIGPFGKTVTDAETIFNAIKGADGNDSTTISDTTYKPERIGKKKPVIGVPRHFLKEGISKDVLKNFEESLESFKKKGYEIVDITLAKYCLLASYILCHYACRSFFKPLALSME
jgi:aspartyl-tRNA(Asn)/glutamyl-tRNA(Gln) amidotransferase subunit A